MLEPADVSREEQWFHETRRKFLIQQGWRETARWSDVWEKVIDEGTLHLSADDAVDWERDHWPDGEESNA